MLYADQETIHGAGTALQLSRSMAALRYQPHSSWMPGCWARRGNTLQELKQLRLLVFSHMLVKVSEFAQICF